MNNLLSLNYWFSVRPEPLMLPAFNALVALLGLLILISIVTAFIKIRPGIYRGFYKRIYNFSLSNTLIGALVLFFNYEEVPFFSARFWIALWIIEMIAWLFLILKNLKDIPNKKKALEESKEKSKYLP